MIKQTSLAWRLDHFDHISFIGIYDLCDLISYTDLHILLSRQEFLKSLFLLLQVHFLLRSLNGIPHSPSYGSVHDMQEIGSLHQFRNVPILHQPDLFPVYKSKMPVFPIPAIHNSELSYHKVLDFLT